MKYSKIIIVVLFVLSFSFLSSCKKENNESLQHEYNFTVFVENSLNNKSTDTLVNLYFPTEIDYDACLEYLLTLNEDNLDNFEKDLHYKSMRRYNNINQTPIDYEDDILLTLLNPNGYFRVGDSLFNINIGNKVTTMTNLAEGHDHTPIIITDPSKCNGEDGRYGIEHEHYTFSGNTTAFLSYRNLVVYHSLVAVVKDDYYSRQYSSKSMLIEQGYYRKRGGSPINFLGGNYSTNSNNPERKLHKTVACTGLKKMIDYYLSVRFYVTPTSTPRETEFMLLKIPDHTK